ncbi:HvfX family Cu-binding RiPP maturation protein [Thalassotalea fusca]
MKLFNIYHSLANRSFHVKSISATLLRLYLAPIFIIAGYSKMNMSNPDVGGFNQLFASQDIVNWFGNSEWGLGLPFPELLANLAAWTEFFGGWLLLVGLLTRFVSIPLLFTMVVAATTVHLDKGWFAITPTNVDASPAKVLTWIGIDQAKVSLSNSEATRVRLNKMKEILDENGNTEWLYENGNIVVLNNGIEFASTYFIMLLVLIGIGGGRFTSVDYYLYNHWIRPKLENKL